MPDRPLLWMTTGSEEAPVRFFLVPRGHRLPDGDLPVQNMQLGAQSVDPEAMADFEVDAAAAQAHIDAGWSTFVGNVRDGWNQLLGRAPSGGPPDLARWLGATPGEVVTDEAKRRQTRRSLIARASGLLGQPLDEAGVDRVEGQIVGLRETVATEGGKLLANLERAADAAVDAVKDAAGVKKGSE